MPSQARATSLLLAGFWLGLGCSGRALKSVRADSGAGPDLAHDVFAPSSPEDGLVPVDSGGGGAPDGDGTVSILDRWIEAHCDYQARCGGSPSKQDCRKVQYESGSPAMAALAYNLDAGRTIHDPARATACFAALAAASCTQADDDAQASACSRVFVGTQATGADCFQDNECSTGYCELPFCGVQSFECPSGTGRCAGGTCVGTWCDPYCCRGTCKEPPVVALGSMCGGSDRCVDGAHCWITPAVDHQICVADVGRGQSCQYATCQAGLTCEAGSRTCIPSPPYPQDGQACTANGPACDRLTSGCDASTRTCSGRLAVGAACSDSWNCTNYAICANGVCTLLPAPGEPCTVPYGGSPLAGCRAGVCVDGSCQFLGAVCTIGSLPAADAGAKD